MARLRRGVRPGLDELHPSEVVLIDFLAESPLLSVYRSGRDMVCHYANEAYQRHFPGMAAVGLSLQATFPGMDLGPVIAKYHRVLDTGVVEHQPEVEVEVDGQTRWFDVYYRRHAHRGQPLGVVGQAIEVTDRVQQRRSHESRLAELERVVAQAPIAMCILDADGVIRSMNEAGATLLGRPTLALLGRGLFELFPEVARFRERLDRVLATGEPFRGIVQPVELFGPSRCFDVTYTRIDGKQGHEVLIVANEVTELANARDRAESALASRDAFFGVVSHELRSPVHAIHGWAQLLARGPAPALREQALAVIQRNAESLDHLVSDLLDAARLHRGQLQLVCRVGDLAHVVNDVVESARPYAGERGVELMVEGTGAPCVLTCDPARLRQVMWNLLHNALRLSMPGGRIDVGLTRGEAEHRLSITDDGPGIAPEQLEAIFAWGASAYEGGTLGVGLALSRQIAELHGGRLVASSPGVGQGATFTLTLPADA